MLVRHAGCGLAEKRTCARLVSIPQHVASRHLDVDAVFREPQSRSLGHNLIQAHSARLAAKYLSKEELSHILWKFYRTLGKAYEYPADLAVQRRDGRDAQAAITGLKATLQHRTPPPLVTIGQCLEAGVPLDGILKQIVGGYSAWRVGEKEHTILFLSAAIQTANFLGEDKALLPLAVALQQLPF